MVRQRMNDAQNVVVMRLGGLGDLVVALPVFNALRRRFPSANIALLTNHPYNSKVINNADLFRGSGLVDTTLSYPAHSRDPVELLRLVKSLRRLSPEVIVDISPREKFVSAVRDRLFLSASGARTIWGGPIGNSRHHMTSPTSGRMESEAARLVRLLHPWLQIDLDEPAAWDLHFTSADQQELEKVLDGTPIQQPYVAFSLGGKYDTQQWSDERWSTVLGEISKQHPNLGLACLGSAAEHSRSQNVAAQWLGPLRNFCGATSPRVSALMMKGAIIFLGQDSGPMHLAAAVGTPCVSVFSARNRPGIWFPNGNIHKTHYREIFCSGCGLDVCLVRGKKCILDITPDEVAQSATEILRSVAATSSRAAVKV